MVELFVFYTAFIAKAAVSSLRRGLILFLMFLGKWQCLMAQSALSDSLPGAAVFSTMYMHAIGGSASIYDGPEYTGSYPGTRGTPFFPVDQFTTGMVSFNGTSYYGINIAYDVVRDEVVIKGPHNLGLTLLSESIDSFRIKDHLFIRHVQDRAVENAPATGFYEVLNPAPLLLAKRVKVVHRGLSAEDPMVFGQFSSYLVRKGNAFHVITGRRALLSLFPGHKKEIRGYWKRVAVNYKKNPETAIVKTIQYFSQAIR